MKYTFFDTETSGFPFKQLGSAHPNQARILQLAAIQTDEFFKEINRLYTLIKLPQGKKINEGAFKKHGKTWEMCDAQGRKSLEVFTEFNELLRTSNVLVAHNFAFDSTMIDIEFDRNEILQYNVDRAYCTMELMTSICQLPHKKKNSFGRKYKWPKLIESYKHCFGKEFDGQHDAMADVNACMEIFRWLIEQKIVKIPSGMAPA